MRGFLTALPDGPTHELVKSRTVIGRGRDCDIVIPSQTIARNHWAVVRERDGFVIEDLGNDGRAWIRPYGGEVSDRSFTRHALADGDAVIQRGGILVFTVDAPPRLPSDETSQRLAATLADEPEDDQRWQVYADRLLEVGSPFGQRAWSDARGWAPWDPVDLRVGSNVEPTWHRGFLRALTLRDLRRYRPAPDEDLRDLQRLVSSELARFLVELEVDPGGSSAWPIVLDALLALKVPTLRRLVVGPFFDPPGVKELRVPGCPRAHVKLLRPLRTWLDVNGAPVAPSRGATVDLPSPDTVRFWVGFSEGRWRLFGRAIEAPFLDGHINGRRLMVTGDAEHAVCLRDDDVLTWPGATVRFCTR